MEQQTAQEEKPVNVTFRVIADEVCKGQMMSISLRQKLVEELTTRAAERKAFIFTVPTEEEINAYADPATRISLLQSKRAVQFINGIDAEGNDALLCWATRRNVAPYESPNQIKVLGRYTVRKKTRCYRYEPIIVTGVQFDPVAGSTVISFITEHGPAEDKKVLTCSLADLSPDSKAGSLEEIVEGVEPVLTEDSSEGCASTVANTTVEAPVFYVEDDDNGTSVVTPVVEEDVPAAAPDAVQEAPQRTSYKKLTSGVKHWRTNKKENKKYDGPRITRDQAKQACMVNITEVASTLGVSSTTLADICKYAQMPHVRVPKLNGGPDAYFVKSVDSVARFILDVMGRDSLPGVYPVVKAWQDRKEEVTKKIEEAGVEAEV